MTTQPKPILHGGDHRPGGADPGFHPVRNLKVAIDGGGTALTPGIKGEASLDFEAIIESWTLLADQAGDVVVDIWKAPYGSYPPTIANTITAGAQPTIAADDHATSSTLTGWTTRINAGDTFRVNLDSVATITRLLLVLAVQPI